MGVGRAAGAEEAAEGMSSVAEEVTEGRGTGREAGRGGAAGEGAKGAAKSSWVMLARHVGHWKTKGRHEYVSSTQKARTRSERGGTHMSLRVEQPRRDLLLVEEVTTRQLHHPLPLLKLAEADRAFGRRIVAPSSPPRRQLSVAVLAARQTDHPARPAGYSEAPPRPSLLAEDRCKKRRCLGWLRTDRPLLVLDDCGSISRLLGIAPQEDGELGYSVPRCSVELLLANDAEALSKDGEEGEERGEEEDEKEEIEKGPVRRG